MLVQLSIRNIVLIESCDIALKNGLCVLSGETGAGKSILLDSLGLVLGARADSGLVRSGQEQGSVTAEFDISANANAKAILAELEMEASDTLIIRRSITADGKTRCIINDAPATVAGLKRLAETLVEIHGQHDQKSLQDAGLHRAMLDDYAKLGSERKQVAEAYRAWRDVRDNIAALKDELARASQEQDYLQHMQRELKQLAPEQGEEETLTNQRTTMMQSEKLFELLNDALGELNGGKGVLASLRGAQRGLTRSPLSSAPAFAAIIEGLEKAAIEAEEAIYALEKAGQDATYDPAKLEQIEERLFALKAAGRKYNLPVDELANLREQVEEKLSRISSQDHLLKALETKLADAKAAFLEVAEKLSEKRKKSAATLEKSIQAELKPLKMESTRFRVRIDRLDESGWSAYGVDEVHFECATNVVKGAENIPFSALNKIASGGELSRFMLAMKVALSATRSTPTMIFDEIDTGTGGAVADAIGQRLGKLAATTQVLVVTHLAQVAARGSQHLRVEKQETSKKVTTQVHELSPKEREEELARMLSGATITQEARAAAQKLLEDAA